MSGCSGASPRSGERPVQVGGMVVAVRARARVSPVGWRYVDTVHDMRIGVFRNPGGKSGSLGDTDGVEIKAAEMKVDGVAESFAVAESAR